MKTVSRFHTWVFALLMAICLPSQAQTTAKTNDAERTRADITALLNTFLSENAKREIHDRFWADDLVYTGSSGLVKTKADILKSFDEAPKPEPGKKSEPSTTFSAEDILVRPYGDTAALTFRLVAHNPDGSSAYYRNSGTLLRRNGKWQVVTWQATKAAAPAQ